MSVFIRDAVRTPRGKARPDGGLAKYVGIEAGARAQRHAVHCFQLMKRHMSALVDVMDIEKRGAASVDVGVVRVH